MPSEDLSCKPFSQEAWVLHVQVARISDTAEQAGGLRLAHPRLASVSVARAAEGGSATVLLRLGFLNLAAQAKFSVELRLGEAVPHTPIWTVMASHACMLALFPSRPAARRLVRYMRQHCYVPAAGAGRSCWAAAAQRLP